MSQIWKFNVPIDDYPAIEMPLAARLLAVHEQSGELCLWALVDPSAPTVRRRLRIAGTGHPVDEDLYVGTAFVGPFVWHVFDCGEV